jgi:DNA repair protein RadC
MTLRIPRALGARLGVEVARRIAAKRGLDNSLKYNGDFMRLPCRYRAAGLLRGEALTDSQAMRDYVRLRLQGYAYEVFACLFLDIRHRVISFEELFSRTLDGNQRPPS